MTIDLAGLREKLRREFNAEIVAIGPIRVGDLAVWPLHAVGDIGVLLTDGKECQQWGWGSRADDLFNWFYRFATSNTEGAVTVPGATVTQVITFRQATQVQP